MFKSKRTSPARLRLSLLTSSSLAAATIMTGAVAGAALAPTAALAACAPASPAVTAGPVECSGPLANQALAYTASGPLTVQLVGATITDSTASGIGIDGAGNPVAVTFYTDGNDTSVVSTAGSGIYVTTHDAGAVVNTTDFDWLSLPATVASDQHNTISGSTNGIWVEETGGAGDITVIVGADTVQGGSGEGIRATHAGGGDIRITTAAGSLVESASGRGIYAYASTGDVTIETAGDIDAAEAGIEATADGAIVINVSGDIISDQNAIYAYGGGAPNADSIDVDVAAGSTLTAVYPYYNIVLYGDRASLVMNGTLVGGAGARVIGAAGGASAEVGGSITTADYYGLEVSAGSLGNAGFSQTGGSIVTTAPGYQAVTVTGIDVSLASAAGASISGTSGGLNVVAHGTLNGVLDGDIAASNGTGASLYATGATNLTFGGTVTGSAGDGIYLQSSSGGAVSLTTTGQVTGSDDGIQVSASGGDVTLSATGGVTGQGDDGITATVTGGGDLAITAGPVSGASSGVVALTFGGGDINVTGAAFGDITGTNNYGVFGLALGGGDANASFGFGSDVSGADDAVVMISTSGSASVTTGLFGDIDSGEDGVTAGVLFGSGSVSVSTGGFGSLDAAQDGIIAFAPGSGAVSVSTGAFNDMNVGGTGIVATNFGAGDVTVSTGFGSDITADVSGIVANADGGDVSVSLGAFTDIDPDQYGVYAYSAGGDATVTTGFGDSIVIDDSLDSTADFTNFGVYAESERAADAGDPSVEVRLGAFNTITVDGGSLNDLDGGIGVYAINTVSGGTGSVAVSAGNGLVIDVHGDASGGIVAASELGDISIVTGSGSVTLNRYDDIALGGLLAGDNVSVGAVSQGGDVLIDTAAYVSAHGGSLIDVVGVGARTIGSGTATIVTRGGVETGSGPAIAADTEAGAISITTSGDPVGAFGDDAIVADSTTGAITINTRSIVGSNGHSAIDADSGSGAITVNNDSTLVAPSDAVVRLSTTGAMTINNDTATSGAGIIGNNGASALALVADGGPVTINNRGSVFGRVDLSGATSSTFNIIPGAGYAATWLVSGTNTFTGGADAINNQASGNLRGYLAASGTTTFNLGAGSDTLTNAGRLASGDGVTSATTTFDFGPSAGTDTAANSGSMDVNGTLTFVNLDSLANSGQLNMGSDGSVGDLISMTGTAFTGSGASLLVVNASLGATVQGSCAALPAADCLRLTNGSTAGSTLVRVNDVSMGAGAYNPDGIVVVDVGGGSSAASHFSLDPVSGYWRADANSADGVLDKGLFFYDLTYDAGSKEHLLAGLPDREAFELPVLVAAVQTVWQTTTGTWFERQADLRDGGTMDQKGGAWLRITGNWAERDKTVSYDHLGVTYSFDVGHQQDTVALVGGLDLVNLVAGDAALVAGLTAGYVDSDVRFDAGPTRTRMEGASFGVYGTYLKGPLFVDAIVNYNDLDVEHDAASLGPVMNGGAKSLGGRIEGGYRFPLGDGATRLEPLATLAYVSTDMGDLAAPGATAQYEDATSFRGALGLRVSHDTAMEPYTVKLGVTGRVWQEFEGDNGVLIAGAGPDLMLTDDFSGTLGDVSLDVSLYSADRRLSAFAKVGVTFKEDYQNTDATIGVRYAW